MKKIVLFCLSILILSCTTEKTPKTVLYADNYPIDSLFADYYHQRAALYPLDATMAGNSNYNHLLTNNLTNDYRDSLIRFYRFYQQAITQYNKQQLSEEQQISCDILRWECDINLQDLNSQHDLISNLSDYHNAFLYMPIDQFWSLNLPVCGLATGNSSQAFKSPKDYHSWLQRATAFATWLDSAKHNMKKGVEKGIVLPKVLIEKMLPQLQAFDHGPIEKHPFYLPIKNMPADFSKQDSLLLAKAYYKMIKNKIIPAFQDLTDYIQNHYYPAGRTTSGIGDLPGGEAAYQYRIRFYTTTNMQADEIFELGQKEVARILQAMDSIKRQIGFKGELAAFFNHLRQSKKLKPFTKPEQVLEHFNSIYHKIQPKLNQLFSHQPKTPFEIKRVAPFIEKTTSLHYVAGSLKNGIPGRFYVPIPNAEEYNTLTDESIFLHEAIPGHHYQISLQQENEQLPEFRKHLWYNAYGEGWALYCESLGKELGLYTDPYQHLGALSMEMHRALRLVIDVGLHTKGWTREEAIRYSLAHEAESEQFIVTEIERYMAGPGQALSYKIGQLAIQKLRNKAEKELGADFDIREFHKELLESGCMPLKVLEDKINRWIENKKKIMRLPKKAYKKGNNR